MSGPRLVVALLSFVLGAVCLGLGVSVTLWSLFSVSQLSSSWLRRLIGSSWTSPDRCTPGMVDHS